ncbi:unnamed protein product [Arctogadus glacialis]
MVQEDVRKGLLAEIKRFSAESIERLNKMRERWPGRDGCRQDESTAAVSRVSEDTAQRQVRKPGSSKSQPAMPEALEGDVPEKD